MKAVPLIMPCNDVRLWMDLKDAHDPFGLVHCMTESLSLLFAAYPFASE